MLPLTKMKTIVWLTEEDPGVNFGQIKFQMNMTFEAIMLDDITKK